MEIHLDTLFYPSYNRIIDYKMEKDGAKCTKKCILPWFNAITDALELLRQREWAEAARLLERAQGQTEELFMEGEE